MFRHLIYCALRLVLLAGFGAAQADTITSMASSLASQSSASVSDSLSSASGSAAGDQVAAAGPYTVTAMAPANDGRVRLQLAPGAGQPQALVLTLPQPLVQAQALRPGQALDLLARPYGWAVARADAAPFFLVIEDRLRRDFESVKL